MLDEASSTECTFLKVTSALQHAESLAHEDSLIEADGRNYIDSLRKVILG